MEIKSLNCPNCSAPLTVEPGDTAIKCSHCGSDLRISSGGEASLFFRNQPQTKETSEGELERLIRAGQKINAIKLYREQTGAGLQEAKKFVDDLEEVMKRAPVSSSSASVAQLSEHPRLDMDEVRRLMQTGHKINAIKYVREQTNMGLKEAKDFVEALEAGNPSPLFSDPHGSGPDWERIRQELAHGRKIEAIKIYREQTGVGLKEAKDAVEMFERGQIPPPPSSPSTPQSIPGQVNLDVIRQMLASGRKIEAVKLYRAQTGVGLKEALDVIDAMPEARTVTGGATGGGSGGCMKTILGIALFILLLLSGCGLYVQTTDEYDCGMDVFIHNREVVQRLGEPVKSLPLAFVLGYSSSSDFGGNSSVGFAMYTLVSGADDRSWVYMEISHHEGSPYYMNANLFHAGDNLRINGSVSESDCTP